MYDQMLWQMVHVWEYLKGHELFATNWAKTHLKQ